jgi:chromosome segregation ATPase
MRARHCPCIILALSLASVLPSLAQDKLDQSKEVGGFADPTRLTTQQLDRAIVDLRQELVTRLEADEKAAALAHEDLVRVPTTVDKAVSAAESVLGARREALEAVMVEKFAGVNTQFVERDKRTEQLTIANSTAIAAALQAQKEAVNEQNRASSEAIDKSNKQTAEAITQLQTLFQSNIGSLSNQLNDLKSRIDRSEGQKGGTGDTYNFIFAAIGAGGVLVAIFVVMDRRRPPRNEA